RRAAHRPRRGVALAALGTGAGGWQCRIRRVGGPQGQLVRGGQQRPHRSTLSGGELTLGLAIMVWMGGGAFLMFLAIISLGVWLDARDRRRKARRPPPKPAPRPTRPSANQPTPPDSVELLRAAVGLYEIRRRLDVERASTELHRGAAQVHQSLVDEL